MKGRSRTLNLQGLACKERLVHLPKSVIHWPIMPAYAPILESIYYAWNYASIIQCLCTTQTVNRYHILKGLEPEWSNWESFCHAWTHLAQRKCLLINEPTIRYRTDCKPILVSCPDPTLRAWGLGMRLIRNGLPLAWYLPVRCLLRYPLPYDNPLPYDTTVMICAKLWVHIANRWVLICSS